MPVFLHFFDETLPACVRFVQSWWTTVHTNIYLVEAGDCRFIYLVEAGDCRFFPWHVKQLYLTAGGVRRRWRPAKPGNKLSTLRDSTSATLCAVLILQIQQSFPPFRVSHAMLLLLLLLPARALSKTQSQAASLH